MTRKGVEIKQHIVESDYAATVFDLETDNRFPPAVTNL